MEKVRCLEFFSGIGGMHCALREIADLEFEVLEAFDINLNANATYQHNFGKKPKAANIEHIAVEQYERYGANCWLMSPPCQPFTRGGNELDSEDNRSKGLLFLIELLGKLKLKPRYLFLENVVGFEKSRCRDLLVGQLRTLGYKVCEFMVSPLDSTIAIPNARMRYYLSASMDKGALENAELLTEIPKLSVCPTDLPKLQPLSFYLDSGWNQEAKWEEYKVPNEYILKTKNFRFDICDPTDYISSTFTKAYGSHHVTSSGSLLRTSNLDVKTYDKSDHDAILCGKVRFFTPTEVARLHAFPSAFAFPPEITRLQQYKLLGNSLNVRVVAELLRILFSTRCPLHEE